MKPLLVSIIALTFSLSTTTLGYKSINISKIENHYISQDQNYLDQNLSFIGEELVGPGCTACHMQYSVDGKSMASYLNENFDPELLVHKDEDPEYITSLVSFLKDHTEDEAAVKYVDYQKVVDYIAEY